MCPFITTVIMTCVISAHLRWRSLLKLSHQKVSLSPRCIAAGSLRSHRLPIRNGGALEVTQEGNILGTVPESLSSSCACVWLRQGADCSVGIKLSSLILSLPALLAKEKISRNCFGEI